VPGFLAYSENRILGGQNPMITVVNDNPFSFAMSTAPNAVTGRVAGIENGTVDIGHIADSAGGTPPLRWGRWIGNVSISDDTKTNQSAVMPPAQGIHFVSGPVAAETLVPGLGVVNFSLQGGTTPTAMYPERVQPVGLPLDVNAGGLQIDFASGKAAIYFSVGFVVPKSNTIPTNWSWTGNLASTGTTPGIFDLPNSTVVLHKDPSGRYTGQFGGQVSGSGTCANGGGSLCSTNSLQGVVDGLVTGANAAAAGVIYRINTPAGGNFRYPVTGVLGFQRNTPQ